MQHYSRILLSLSSLLAVICLLNQQVLCESVDNDLSAAASDDLLLNSQHLMGVKCGPDEYLAAGKIKSCEPTCKYQNAICPRIFFASLDYYPCFCKEPLVRNEQTNKCVPVAECP